MELRRGSQALGFGMLQHLRSKHGNSGTCTTVEMRHDVFRYLFNKKGYVQTIEVGSSMTGKISFVVVYQDYGILTLTILEMAKE